MRCGEPSMARQDLTRSSHIVNAVGACVRNTRGPGLVMQDIGTDAMLAEETIVGSC